jgi:hypothetical protein
MAEINLSTATRARRPIDERAANITDADRAIARRFGRVLRRRPARLRRLRPPSALLDRDGGAFS